MKTRRFVGAGLLSVLLPLFFLTLAGTSAERDAAAGGLSLTIYTDNLALIRQRLDRPLRPGAHTVRIEGLPASVDRSSIIVLNAGVVLLGAHGFRTYQDAATGPGASIDLDVQVDRAVDVLELAFLTTGLSWSADYAVIVARDDRAARVDGFANVINNSGTGFTSAEVQLLAGTIQRGAGSMYRADQMRTVAFEMDAAMSQAPKLDQAAFGDYHLYTVSEPLSLGSGESRRIRLLGAGSARTRKLYTLSGNVQYHRQIAEAVKQPVVTSYRIERPKESELGSLPLPAGQVRVYQEDEAGRLQLLGIAAISNMPKGVALHVTTGFAFDIVGTRTQTDYSRPGGNVYESTWKVELKNASDDDVTVQVIDRLSGDWTILESSHEAEKISAGAVRFEVDVAAGGSSVLEYRISVRS